jgi:hypothetical protein
MRNHTLVDCIRNKNEKEVNDLRVYEPPSEVRVYDQNHNLIRIEQPPVPSKLNFVGRKVDNAKQ